MEKIKGKPVSSGIVTGRALLYNSHKEIVLREKIDKDAIETEINRFNNAVKKTRAQLKKIFQNLQRTMGKDSALIIETQYLLLKEGNLVNDIKDMIITHSVKSEWAIKEIEKNYIEVFNNIPDLTFRERSNDISDVLIRLLNNLKDRNKHNEAGIENVILVADDIPPSIAANLMSGGKLLGLVLDNGGETSHTTILARTLEIPTILHTHNATQVISNDDLLIIDALSGEVLVNPTKSTISKIAIKKEKYEVYKERLREVIKLPNKTKDNHEFNLLGNIELAFESDILQAYDAQGIGLFRTEFLFMDPNIALSGEEQFLVYKNIAQKMYPHPVVIRTFDVGRDKTYQYFKTEEDEINPALGTMAVRLFLKEKKLFITQIKAILRANESGNIKMMFPMITEVEEIHTIKRLIAQAKNELIAEKKYPGKDPQLGIMLEIPGTVSLIRYLKDHIDFFSVGTNDLTQYLLAVDRNKDSVAYLYSPYHPGVLKILADIIKEVNKIGKDVTVCGEMAGKPFTALLLLGMGYTNLSMTPLAITEIKRVFTQIHFSYIKKTVKQLAQLSSRTEVEEFLIETMLKKYPGLFINHPIF
ncbi:MAG: phosphoenolpyruvate--protein phosphotransferase [bacterium]|nr:phosphoenolpyruvate--protein phosphotransferase [bacterium]